MSVKVIQVGLGGWGMNWAHTILPQVKAVDVVGFVDASPDVLKRAQETLGLAEEKCFPSLDAALAALDAEAVLAVLPTAGHKTVSEAAKAGALSAAVQEKRDEVGSTPNVPPPHP